MAPIALCGKVNGDAAAPNAGENDKQTGQRSSNGQENGEYSLFFRFYRIY